MSGLEIDDTGYVIVGASLLTMRGGGSGPELHARNSVKLRAIRTIHYRSVDCNAIDSGPRASREFSAEVPPSAAAGISEGGRAAIREAITRAEGRL